MKRPKPIVMNKTPSHMGGRYWPVTLMNTPAMIDNTDKDRMKGKRYTPDRIGVAPRTAWK